MKLNPRFATGREGRRLKTQKQQREARGGGTVSALPGAERGEGPEPRTRGHGERDRQLAR